MEELRENKKLTKLNYATIVEACYDGVGIINSKGEIEFSNNAGSRLLGWPKEEIVDQPFMKVIHPDYHEFILKKWAEVQSEKGKPYEMDIVTKRGERRTMFSSHIHMDIDGERKYCVILKDITDRKKSEVELKKYKDHLEELVDERTSELKKAYEELKKIDKIRSAILRDVSHELKTPVALITMASNLLKCEIEKAEPSIIRMEKCIAIISRNSERFGTEISSILEISRLEAGKEIGLRKSNALEIIDSVIAYYAETISKKGLVLIEDVEDAGNVLVSMDSMRTLIRNLISNSIKFTSKGKITITCKRLNGTLSIIVEDTGKGISDDDIGKLFKPFSKLESSKEGLGLGLVICKKIVDLHNGSIVMNSKLGEGTKVTVVLPVSKSGGIK